LQDKGISASTGRNLSPDSVLGNFLKLVENGEIEKGTVLVVESMHRIFR
jgi:hypothetical protein